MAVVFIPELECMISGADDGDLYVVEGRAVVKRQRALENGYVFCLSTSRNNN